MREGQGYAGNEALRRNDYPVDPSDPLQQGSAQSLDRAVIQVERIVDEFEKLLILITGPRNVINKEEKSPPRQVPTLAHMLEQAPAAIAIQYDRAAKLHEEIRQALKI